MARCLPGILARIGRLAVDKRVRFTLKALKGMTTMRRRKRPARGPALSNDACPTCGTTMRRQTRGASLSINGERMAVPSFPHLRCPQCGERVLSLAEARELQRRAIERYRAKYHLLSAEQIRAIRNRHDLTQADLARLLRLGGNTISRWEAGRNVQTAAMDVLLRLIRDLPGAFTYLRDHAA